MNLLKFAAIDIGTNGVRLLFSNVTEYHDKVTFKKASVVRVPVRLGSGGNINKIAKVTGIKYMSPNPASKSGKAMSGSCPIPWRKG